MHKEEELLIQISEGDEKAFQQLLDFHAPTLHTYLHRLVQNRELAEELVQDIFLKIWQTRENLRRVKSFRAYLFILSRNAALNAVKKFLREKKKEQDWQNYSFSGAENIEENEWRYSLIDEAIEHLPPQQQAVLIKSRRQGMKLDEIAVEMKLTKTTVKKYLQRALEAICKFIETRMDTLLILWMFNTL